LGDILVAFKDYIIRKNTNSLQSVESNQIRLIHLGLNLYDSGYKGKKILTHEYFASSPFHIPEGLSMEDALKVISYLSSHTPDGQRVKPLSNIFLVNDQLEDFGFTRINLIQNERTKTTQRYDGIILPTIEIDTHIDLPEVIDIITTSDKKIFQKTSLAKKYFDWYIPNINAQDIDEIYKKTNIIINPNQSYM
jgi:hypothetical protein